MRVIGKGSKYENYVSEEAEAVESVGTSELTFDTSGVKQTISSKKNKKTNEFNYNYMPDNLIEIIGDELEKVKADFIGFSFERTIRRKRDPEFYKLYFNGEWLGELWAAKEGPSLWTNTVSADDRNNAPLLPKGTKNGAPDVLYLKESSVEKGFHYKMILSATDRIYEVISHVLKVYIGKE